MFYLPVGHHVLYQDLTEVIHSVIYNSDTFGTGGIFSKKYILIKTKEEVVCDIQRSDHHNISICLCTVKALVESALQQKVFASIHYFQRYGVLHKNLQLRLDHLYVAVFRFSACLVVQ